MRKKTSAIFPVLLCFLLIFYQLQFSESARIQKNLSDFGKTKSLYSSEVEPSDLKNIERSEGGYPFTVLKKNEVQDPKKLGIVEMKGKEESLINTFTLFKSEDGYVVYMRGIYMSINQ
ncbi:MAG: hypothetical protein Q3993_06670 [Filifactor alocis]|nr:hypothetical protein [Filifactor alocis]